MIYYLRFADEAHAKQVLAPFVTDGHWRVASHSHSIDVIGPMIIDDAILDDHGNVYVPAKWDMRFHVNFQGEIGIDVSQFAVSPQSPRRVWA